MWGVKGESCEGVRGGGGGGGGRDVGVSWASLTASSISESFKPVKNIFFKYHYSFFHEPFFLRKAFFWSRGLPSTRGLLRNFTATSTCAPPAGATSFRLESWKERLYHLPDSL